MKVVALLILLHLVVPGAATAQVRGVYPLGMSALNAGVMPEPGFSYANQLLFYARNELVGPEGERVATGMNSVILAMHSLVWVAGTRPLGARFSMAATLPLASNSLTSDAAGAKSGGGGLGDSYYQPVIVGWTPAGVSVRVMYGFLAPTGAFDPDSDHNVGSGYWTHAFSSGQTWPLTRGGRLSASTFQMYERHTAQQDTDITPGDTLNVDYSIVGSFALPRTARLQIGLAGYQQWQTTATRGPLVTAEEADLRYRVNALGAAAGVTWPQRRLSLSVKYLAEFHNRSTFQGYSLQTSGAIGF